METKPWQTSAQEYLIRLGAAEYETAMKQHKKAGRSLKTYRHTPSAYQLNLIAILQTNDEEAFKAAKMLQGYASVLKV